jgi:HAD superfamily hydrolase (TIGR01509 family)
MIRAVVFDLDGLLVDSEPMWFRARREIFQRFGLVWTEIDQKKQMGVSTATWADYIAQKLQGKLSREEIVRESLSKMASYYQVGEVRLMPGAREALEYCAGKFKLGLASGSPKLLIDAALRGADWQHYFSETLSSDEVKHGKPAPDVYWEVMKRMGVAPAEAVVVEDSGGGILAGKAAGAKVIAVPNPEMMPGPEALRQADAVIDSLLSLSRAVEELKGTAKNE